MKRSEKRILTTHVGSLVRSPEIKALAGAANPTTIAHATVEVVRKQAAVGLDIVSDGEYGKSSWSNYVLSRLSGFETRRNELRPVPWLGRDIARFPDVMEREMPHVIHGLPTDACTGPIEYRDREPVRRAIANFQAALNDVHVEEAFLTAVAPASTPYDGVNEYYPTDKDYVFALAEALRQEYLEIYQSGLPVQVDDAVLANMYDHWVQQSPARYWSGRSSGWTR
jgi:5-methyltetrahydropteroyltriglutamate--homocysteine methyltransferase